MLAHNDNRKPDPRHSYELVLVDKYNRQLGYTTRVIDVAKDGTMSVTMSGYRCAVTMREDGSYAAMLVL